MIDRVGQQLGNYRLLRLLGSGSIAEVYLGEHIYLRTQVAIKVRRMQVAGSDLENFLNEARAIARLNHPNIVPVLEFGVENNTPYLVMEYLLNGTLRQRYPWGTRLLPEITVPYVKQIVAALHYAHSERLIHRDIKPENIFFGSNNELRLSDFGIDLMTQSSLYQGQVVIGTVAYMAPEQLQGKPRPASDQYSLATTIYEWLSGDFPFHGSFTETANQQISTPPPPLREKIPEIPLAVEQVILTGLSKDPQQRFGNIQAFATAFAQAAQSDLPTIVTPFNQAAPSPAIPPPPPPSPFVLPPYGTAPAYQATTPQTPPSLSSPFYPTAPQAPQTFPEQPQPYQPYPPLQAPLAQQQVYPPPQQLPVQPAPRQRQKFSVALIAAIILLILLLTAGSALILYSAVLQPNTIHSQATATARAQAQTQQTQTQQATNANATASTQASATALALANAHATATAQASATATALQNIYTQATTGSPDLTDPLTGTDTNAWEVGTSSSGSGCIFTSGAYHSIITDTGFFQPCFAEATNYSNFAYQVEMKITKGDAGGILFRGNNASFKLYQFSIGQDGSYALYAYQDRQHSKTLIPTSTSPAIKKGTGQTNLLTVVAQGNHLYLYVNKHYVTSISDSTASSGQIGLFAQDNTNSTDVSFNNVQVWKM